MKKGKRTKIESQHKEEHPANPDNLANVELHIKKLQSKKKLLTVLNVVWILVIAGCVIYLGFYYFQSIKHKKESQNLAAGIEALRQEASVTERPQQETEAVGSIVDTSGTDELQNDEKLNNVDMSENAEDYFETLTESQKQIQTLGMIQAMYASYSQTLANSICVLPQYRSLYLMNPDLCGWLRIPDTNIDYPVMQSDDNIFYLDKSFDRTYARCGSIFADASDDVFGHSDNIILYGHNMKDGTMFHTLLSYDSEEFYQNHPFIWFDTIYQEQKYEVVAAFYTQIYAKNSTEFKYYQFHKAENEEEFNSYIEHIRELSIYDTNIVPAFGDQLITLSTCAYHTENGRFVVVARKSMAIE